jgi:pectate lyase
MNLSTPMTGTAATTIYVSGTLTFSGQVAINGARTKLCMVCRGRHSLTLSTRRVVSKTGILMLKNSKNIILRNLTFKGAGAYDIDGKDNPRYKTAPISGLEPLRLSGWGGW